MTRVSCFLLNDDGVDVIAHFRNNIFIMIMFISNVFIPTLVLLLFFTPALSICPRHEDYRHLWTLGEVQVYNQDHTCSFCLFITNETIVHAFSKPNSATTCDGNKDGESFCVGSVYNKRWGDFWPVFVPDAWGPRNSHHLMDPFTLTHLHHGTLWYTFTSFYFTQVRHFRYAFIVLALLEGIWEYEENHIYVIRRFRSGGLSREYHGDAILNSVGDWLAAVWVLEYVGGCRKRIPSRGRVEQPFGLF